MDSGISQHDEDVLNRIFNPNLPYNNDEEAKEVIQSEIETEDDLRAKPYEVEAIKLAEKGEMDQAFAKLNEAIKLAPNRASCFNNRAQVYRLIGDLNNALKDLDTAIDLSKSKGKAACQAFTQRALIRKLQGNDDGAICDFKSAAGLGSDFAKSQVIAMNPYAALCNQMLGEMISKLKKGETD
ncbi:DgyrCDS4746 [Dimorphilus gyrociliatus]|uniref:DgyrCDS4746 n=1 Tax=Dimorphilus gyrociliatus TaxID=2664684 RepID=A0A7I8VKI8_9ANNE|nr:DgyrCDS4746 [Dimorphilus gyrociliatus]